MTKYHVIVHYGGEIRRRIPCKTKGRAFRRAERAIRFDWSLDVLGVVNVRTGAEWRPNWNGRGLRWEGGEIV